MEKDDYSKMDPASEYNENDTKKNDGIEIVEKGTKLPPDLFTNEVLEAADESLPTRNKTVKI